MNRKNEASSYNYLPTYIIGKKENLWNEKEFTKMKKM